MPAAKNPIGLLKSILLKYCSHHGRDTTAASGIEISGGIQAGQSTIATNVIEIDLILP